MSKNWQIPKSLPAVQRKQVRRVLKHHHNARQLCDEGNFDKAADLLVEDNFFVASNCVRQMKQPTAA
jgi:hypothetical protein